MFATLSRLWNAFIRLAVAVEDLAGTAEEANAGIRCQLGLPAPVSRLPVHVEASAAGSSRPAVEIATAGGNGHASPGNVAVRTSRRGRS